VTRRFVAPRLLAAALLCSAATALAQDTAVYRPSSAEYRRPAKEIYLVAPASGTPLGAPYHFQAMVLDSVNNQFHPQVRWKSSDTTVATIHATSALEAVMDGKRAGRTVITASTDSLIKSIIVYVGRMPPAKTIAILPRRVHIEIGDVVRLLPLARDSLHRLMPPGFLLWSWTDTSVVRDVGTTGEQEQTLRGVRNGEITIYADRDGRSAEATLIVGSGGKSPRVRSISLTPRDTVVHVRDTFDLTALPIGDDGKALAGRLVRWAPCDTSKVRRWNFVARESSHITYRAMRAGTCTITVTSGAVRKSVRVVIRP
jgi:hypothetical protein